MRKVKQIAVNALLGIILTVSAFSLSAQCTPPPYIGEAPALTPDEFIVLDESKVDVYYDTHFGVTREYYGAKCGVNPITLRFVTENDVALKQRIYAELWKQEYDCNGVVIVGAFTLVETSPTVLYDGNTSPIHIDFDVNVEANHSYRIKRFSRTKFGPIFGALTVSESANLRFIAPANNPEPNGHFTNVLSTDSRSALNGWVVDVDQLDVNGLFHFNAVPTSCEVNWRYYIKEFDLATWTSSNAYASPVINGQAGSIDMDAVYPYAFQKGQVYLLTLVAGAGWHAKNYWFELKDASICGSISNNGYVFETVNASESDEYIAHNPNQYLLYERCQYNAMKLYTECTESEDAYKLTLQAVNQFYLPVGLSQTTGWQNGPVNAEYNIGAIFGAMAFGQRYKLTYEIQAPYAIKTFYFRYKDCSQVGNPDDPEYRTKLTETDKEDRFNVYPNPSTDLFYIAKPAGDESYQLEVYNLQGSLVYRNTNAQGNTLSFSLAAQEAGIYLLKIINGDHVVTKRLVKQ